MSKLDGTPDPLTYGEALAALAKVAPFGSAEVRDEVVRAIQGEHGILPPEPEPDPNSPEGKLAAQQREIDDLKARLATPAETPQTDGA